ncbi:MAG: flippase [bacterium]
MTRVKSNLKYQLLGKGSGKLFALLFYVFLARFLGEEAYGEFTYALVICFIFGQPLVLMGQDLLVAKWVSRGKTGILRSSFRVWALSSLTAAAVIIILSLFIRVNRPVLYLLLGYLVFMIFEEILYSYRRGQENMKLEGIFFPLQRVVVVLLVFVFAWTGFKDPAGGALALLLPAVIGAVFLSCIMRKDISGSLSDPDKSIDARSLFKEGISLSAVTFLWMIYFRVDSFMLGALADMKAVGVYNGAYRLIEGVFFLPGVILMVYFPGLAKKTDFRKKFLKVFFLLTGLGIVFAGGVLVLSPLIIKILYSGEFTGSAPVLRLLSIALFFVFIGHLTTQSLVALDMNRTYLILTGAGALINVVLNYFMIPVYGPEGAAMVTVITEFFVTLFTGGMAWLKSASL